MAMLLARNAMRSGPKRNFVGVQQRRFLNNGESAPWQILANEGQLPHIPLVCALEVATCTLLIA